MVKRTTIDVAHTDGRIWKDDRQVLPETYSKNPINAILGGTAGEVINVFDLVNRLESEAHAGRHGRPAVI